MILGVLLGFAALAAISSLVGGGETETDDPVTGDGGLRVIGSGEGDLLLGGAGDDLFFGRGGDDLLIGQDGDDRLFGEDGNDSILGGSGDDILRGGAGDDLIIDGDGADRLMGDTGDDVIIASAVVDPGALADLIATQAPDQPQDIDLTQLPVDFSNDSDSAGDQISGGYGDDLILAGAGDTITAGEGLDDLILGDWIGDDGPATITDFSKLEDTLIYAYDGTGDAPEMTLDYTTDSFGDPQDALLFANAQLVATIKGMGDYFSLDDVVLTAFSPTSPTP